MRNMNNDQKRAWNLYMEGLKYKEIELQTGISIHTLKSWQKKFKWNRKITLPNEVSNTMSKGKRVSRETEKFKRLRGGLLEQLEKNGNTKPHFEDLVNDYMRMWNIKNALMEDVEVRGVQIPYKNGEKQFGTKKNDSVDSIIKYNSQMLSLLDKLGLQADIDLDGDDDVEL